MVLTTGLRGSVRQLTAFQDLFKITGAVIFCTLLYIEVFARVPLVLALVRLLSTRVDRQMALVFLLFNLTMAVACTLALPAIADLLQYWLPADEQDDLSTPRFIFDEALDEPASALDLIDHEQRSLVRRLRGYTGAMRASPDAPEREKARLIHDPFAKVASRLDHFQHDLANRQLGAVEAERLAKLQNRLSLIVYLEDSVRELFGATTSIPRDGRLGQLIAQLTEGLDFILLTIIDALEEGGEAVDLLTTITGDRSDLIERVRQRFLADDTAVNAAERAALLHITNVFERTTWMTHRLARMVDGLQYA